MATPLLRQAASGPVVGDSSSSAFSVVFQGTVSPSSRSVQANRTTDLSVAIPGVRSGDMVIVNQTDSSSTRLPIGLIGVTHRIARDGEVLITVANLTPGTLGIPPGVQFVVAVLRFSGES